MKIETCPKKLWLRWHSNRVPWRAEAAAVDDPCGTNWRGIPATRVGYESGAEEIWAGHFYGCDGALLQLTIPDGWVAEEQPQFNEFCYDSSKDDHPYADWMTARRRQIREAMGRAKG